MTVIADEVLRSVQQIVGAERMPERTTSLHVVADLSLDSLELLEIVMVAEDIASVVVPEEYFEAIATLDDLIAIVSQIALNESDQ